MGERFGDVPGIKSRRGLAPVTKRYVGGFRYYRPKARREVLQELGGNNGHQEGESASVSVDEVVASRGGFEAASLISCAEAVRLRRLQRACTSLISDDLFGHNAT